MKTAKTITVIPIHRTGGSKIGLLQTMYHDIVSKIFEPNVTDIDDSEKVKASWGFEDADGRQGFIWCYKYYGKIENCNQWSVDSDRSLLTELFGDKVTF